MSERLKDLLQPAKSHTNDRSLEWTSMCRFRCSYRLKLHPQPGDRHGCLLPDVLPVEDTLVVEQTELLRLTLAPPISLAGDSSSVELEFRLLSTDPDMKLSGIGDGQADELVLDGMTWLRL